MPTGGFYTGAQPLSGNFLSKIFGSKPVVPPIEEVKLPEAQLDAIAANKAAAPGAAELARLSQEQIRAMMRFAIPGFDQATGLVGRNIIDMLQGKIPSDVAAMSRIGTAGRALRGGYASGTPGSMGSNLEARDLAYTSYGIMKEGQSAMQSWLGAMEHLYAPSQALYSSMFFNPLNLYQAKREQSNINFSRSYLVNQIQAMPDPTVRGIYDTIMNLVNSYLGGSYQGQSNPNYGSGGTVTNPGTGSSWGQWGGSAGYGPSNTGTGMNYGGTFDNYIGGAAAGAF